MHHVSIPHLRTRTVCQGSDPHQLLGHTTRGLTLMIYTLTPRRDTLVEDALPICAYQNDNNSWHRPRVTLVALSAFAVLCYGNNSRTVQKPLLEPYPHCQNIVLAIFHRLILGFFLSANSI